jgi:hypothetical protein
MEMGGKVEEMRGYTVYIGEWRWVAKLVARLLAPVALWVRIQTSTLARQKNIRKKRFPRTRKRDECYGYVIFVLFS